MLLINIIVLGSLFLLLVLEELRYRKQQRRVEEVRQSLLAIVYQIRSPLTTISKFNHFLRRGEFGKLTLGQTEALCHVEAALNDVVVGFNRFLIASKLEKGTVDRSSITDIRETLTAAIHAVDGVVAERHHQVNYRSGDRPLTVRADPLVLHGIFDELLLNAAAFTTHGGVITVTAKRDGKHVVVTVKDTGVGIAEEDSAHIFEKFFRSPRTRTMHTGSGLGLSFARELLSGIGGSIRFTSAIDKGSTFTVKLPYRKVGA